MLYSAPRQSQPLRPGPPLSTHPFKPDAKPRQISSNLWLFQDTCNVQVVRSGSRAMLVHFESGAACDHSPELGVSQMDGIHHVSFDFVIRLAVK